MGTLVPILTGSGVVAGVLLKRSKAEAPGWTVTTTGLAFAVMAAVFTANACGSPNGHLILAVTLSAAVSSGHYEKLLPYTAAQRLGAMSSATLVWDHFLPHRALPEDADANLACYAAAPAIANPRANFASEMIRTMLLVFVAKESSQSRLPQAWGLIW